MATNYIWEKLKENRGKYFVEYIPLRSEDSYASLNLVFLNYIKADQIANTMESEFDAWISRFPVPLMVSSFNDKEELISLDGVRPVDHLFGFMDIGTNKPIKHWSLLHDNAFPEEQLKEDYIKKIYKDRLPFKAKEKLDQRNELHRKQLRFGVFIIFVCIVILPAIGSIFWWATSLLNILILRYILSIIVLGSILWKAIKKGLKFWGKWKKSEKEKQKEKEEQKKEHYYYHCELNPKGFERLKIENFEREAIERTRKEAEDLRNKKDQTKI